MSGEASASTGPPASFYAVQHDLAGLSGRQDESSGPQEVDPALEEKRRKARERQRRKRERDRANGSHRAPIGTGPEREVINDAEAQRAEMKKIKARERQRKHRELAKARKNQDIAPVVHEPDQSHVVESSQERAPGVVPPPPPPRQNQHQAHPNQINTETPAPPPAHHAPSQETTYTERSSAPSQSVVSPPSAPSRAPAVIQDRGDFFANALFSAISRLPELRNHLFETLRMTEDDLMSFQGILSAQFNHWDDQRMRIAHTIAGHVGRIVGAPESTLVPPRSSWAPIQASTSQASTSQAAASSSSSLQPHSHPHPLTPLTPPSQPRTPGDAHPSTVRRPATSVSHTAATTYQPPQQTPTDVQPQWQQQPSSTHGTAPATPHQPTRSNTQEHPTIQTTAPTSTVQSHPPPQHPPPQMQYVQHAAIAAQQQHQSLRTYHPSAAPTEAQIPHSHSHNQGAYTSTSPVVLHSRTGAVHPSVGPTRVHHEQQDKGHRHQPY